MHLCISTLINYSPISNMSTPFIWWNVKFVQINELVSYMIHHKSQCLRVYGFGYQYFKSIRRYQLGLKLYLCPCPWAQTHTCIHAHKVWYSQVHEYFVLVAISTAWMVLKIWDSGGLDMIRLASFGNGFVLLPSSSRTGSGAAYEICKIGWRTSFKCDFAGSH